MDKKTIEIILALLVVLEEQGCVDVWINPEEDDDHGVDLNINFKKPKVQKTK